jgi:hypothetical protein
VCNRLVLHGLCFSWSAHALVLTQPRVGCRAARAGPASLGSSRTRTTRPHIRCMRSRTPTLGQCTYTLSDKAAPRSRWLGPRAVRVALAFGRRLPGRAGVCGPAAVHRADCRRVLHEVRGVPGRAGAARESNLGLYLRGCPVTAVPIWFWGDAVVHLGAAALPGRPSDPCCRAGNIRVGACGPRLQPGHQLHPVPSL